MKNFSGQKKKEFDILGVPIYHPDFTGQFDLLADAAFALTCREDWEDKLNGYPYVGIWSYDEKGKMFYLIASLTGEGGDTPPGMIRQTIGAGQYAIFSAERSGDGEKDAEISYRGSTHRCRFLSIDREA